MEPDPLLDNIFERLRVKDEVYGGPKLSTDLGRCKLYQHTLGWKHNIRSLGPAKISDVKCVASYNWVRKDRVTALIPGKEIPILIWSVLAQQQYSVTNVNHE